MKRRRWSPTVKPVVGTGTKYQPSEYMIGQAAGFIAQGLRRMDDAGGEFSHVGCVKAAFHNAGHQNVTPATCESCSEEFVPPCLICENAFNFAARELVESGAVALKPGPDGEMSLFVADRARLDAVPEPRWRS
jgi:hypothetical protein